MKNEVLFSEKQYFRQWWLMLLFLFTAAGLSLLTYQHVVQNLKLTSMLIAWFVITAMFLLFCLTHLKTVITEEGFIIQFFPFVKKQISWKEIGQAYVREYRPLGEFGGWGIRFGFTGGKAYTVAGNKGIQLELTDGSKILIGTQNLNELEVVLRRIRKQSSHYE